MSSEEWAELDLAIKEVNLNEDSVSLVKPCIEALLDIVNRYRLELDSPVVEETIEERKLRAASTKVLGRVYNLLS